ncbi:hypothetical protein C8J56DRAFT_718557, partial [Mycena floridula]
ICSLDGSPLRDPRIRNRHCGPFSSEKAFNDFRLSLVELYRHDSWSNDIITSIEHELRDGHRIVFTHGDIRDCNILLDDNYQVVALIDWEMAGWMPEY